MKKCDIIVPVYNAYEYVEKCIKSVIRNTDLDVHTLILINDCSSDVRITSLLEFFVEKNPKLNLVHLENENNLGFVGTVNRGMSYSENDVLLLNSDTEVGPNWLKNIMECAYSAVDVATVTPLSNNATLVSVPKQYQRNDLPNNMSFDEYCRLIESSSMLEYPELPTAHGFCMYIRRDALDLVGYFDEEHFGKGYGEENDFCYRCFEFGLKHLLCDNVIVYHKESQSFSESRLLLTKKHMEILKEIHPKYTYATDKWLERNPLLPLSVKVLYNIHMKDRINILFVVHEWSSMNTGVGGTTYHCYDLIKNLRNRFNIHVIYPNNGMYKVSSYFKDSEGELPISVQETESFFNKKYRKEMAEIIDALNIKLVHIHHLMHHHHDIIDVAKDKRIPCVFTLHDFYSICPGANLLYKNQDYCSQIHNVNCKDCLNYRKFAKNDITSHWKEIWHNSLNKCDYLITPSESTKTIINTYFPDLICNPIEHGIDIEKINSEIYIGNKVNLAFVGVLAEHKGLRVVEKIVANVKGKNISFHLFGSTESKVLKHSQNITIHGSYKRDELPNLLKKNNINLVCIASICPETFSFTLIEAIGAGIPVVCFNIGAVGERVKKYGLGVCVDYSLGSNGMEKAIKELLANSRKLEEYANNVANYKIRTSKEMAFDYENLYSKLIHDNTYTHNYKALSDFVDKAYDERLVTVYKELDRVLSSRKWKVVSKIKVPRIIRKLANGGEDS